MFVKSSACGANELAKKKAGLPALVFFFVPPSGTIGLLEDFFSQANRLRRHFHQFVVGDPLDSLFQPHLAVRRNDDILIAAGGANIGQLFSRVMLTFRSTSREYSPTTIPS